MTSVRCLASLDQSFGTAFSMDRIFFSSRTIVLTAKPNDFLRAFSISGTKFSASFLEEEKMTLPELI